MHDSFEIAEEDWRALREAGAIITPYQEYDFLHAWYECLGRAEGTGLRIVVGRDTRGRAAFLWPLGKCNCYGLPTLGWLGGKHANYTMGIYSPTPSARCSRETGARC